MDKTTPEPKKKALPKKTAPFLTINNSNLLGWLISSFIVCGCMFFLGVMVGRNTAPVQFDVERLEEKLSNLQVSVLKQKEADTEKTPDSATSDGSDSPVIKDTADLVEELTNIHEDIIDQLKDKGKEPKIYEQFVPPVLTPKYPKTPPAAKTPAPEKKTAPAPEVQTAGPEPVTTPKPEIPPVSAETSAPVVKSESIAAAQNAPAAEQDSPEVSTPETVKPESTKPEYAKPAAADQGFAIQVASLKDSDKARMLMNKFREKGYPAFCQSSEVNGATWHRVRIGPYPERALAEKDRERLKAAGVDSLIISMN